jgi:hypothetical protein
MKRKKWFIALTLILIVTSLACNFSLGGPKPPGSPIPVTTEEVENLEESLEDAYAEGLAGGEVTVEITEAQLTSMVAFELQGQENLSIKDPQVYLHDGEIQFFATVEQPAFAAVMKVVMTLSVDSAGKPKFTFVSAKIGPLSVPDSIMDDLETYVDRSFAAQINGMASDIHIDKITIEDGVMTIVGQKE